MIEFNSLKKAKSIKELLEFSIINIDKPVEHTSFDVDSRIKKLFGLKKTAHFGTLDPMVTGVLPVALNRACRLLDFFMHKNKTYIGEMHLHKEISREDLEKEMKKFLGIIIQKPPVKSRVKRVEREREIINFKILKFDKEKQNAEFLAEVQAGTYIRKLIHDLGENIGGAQMTNLRRIKAGLFEEKDIVKIEDIENAVKLWKEKQDGSRLREILIPAEIIMKLYPVIQIKKTSLKEILNGKPLLEKDLEVGMEKEIKKIVSKADDGIFIVFCRERFVGVYKKSDEKEIIARAKFVKD